MKPPTESATAPVEDEKHFLTHRLPRLGVVWYGVVPNWPTILATRVKRAASQEEAEDAYRCVAISDRLVQILVYVAISKPMPEDRLNIRSCFAVLQIL